MARPTDEKKNKIVKLRISEDLYADLASRGPNLSDTIRKILKGEGFVPRNAELPAGLVEMAGCFGLSGEELLDMVVFALDDGRLTIRNGGLVAIEEKWIEDFRETCHDLCIPVEKAVSSACKALRKGEI